MPLTRNNHHTYRENLFVVGLRGNVAKTDASHTRHGEVQCSHVHRFPRRTVY